MRLCRFRNLLFKFLRPCVPVVFNEHAIFADIFDLHSELQLQHHRIIYAIELIRIFVFLSLHLLVFVSIVFAVSNPIPDFLPELRQQ